MLEMIKRLASEEQGQGMAEYGLILALIAIAVIATLTGVGQQISAKFTEVTGALD